jgi:hypothetical protein
VPILKSAAIAKEVPAVIVTIPSNKLLTEFVALTLLPVTKACVAVLTVKVIVPEEAGVADVVEVTV